jgi:hypothetical protein
MTRRLEQEFIDGNADPKAAEKVYRLMRVDEALESLAGTMGRQDTPSKVKREIYKKIFRSQLDKLEDMLGREQATASAASAE